MEYPRFNKKTSSTGPFSMAMLDYLSVVWICTQTTTSATSNKSAYLFMAQLPHQ